LKILSAVSIGVISILGTFSARAGDLKLPELKKQPSAQAVLDEHLDASTNATGTGSWRSIRTTRRSTCRGTIVKGRADIGDLFAGFCKTIRMAA
jgi:hypothetical protein